MTTCSSCGTENPNGQKFCGECATPLGVSARPSAEERKVITALFCDLIGFTATSESADPEDVDRMLSAYAAMARDRIEAYGGVVERFIGDAVVGIFGVPAAHEDDPERAVGSAQPWCSRRPMRSCKRPPRSTPDAGSASVECGGVSGGAALRPLDVGSAGAAVR